MANSKRTPLGIVGVLLLAGVVWFAREKGWISGGDSGGSAPAVPAKVKPREAGTTSTARGTGKIAELFAAERSGVMVEFEGSVKATLADDNEGSRHQKFIVLLGDGHTVLVSHNIDLAPRVPLSRDDRVTIRGQYEWNDRGGVVHWTHHDPRGKHDEGWIEYEGKRYE